MRWRKQIRGTQVMWQADGALWHAPDIPVAGQGSSGLPKLQKGSSGSLGYIPERILFTGVKQLDYYRHITRKLSVPALWNRTERGCTVHVSLCRKEGPLISHWGSRSLCLSGWELSRACALIKSRHDAVTAQPRSHRPYSFVGVLQRATWVFVVKYTMQLNAGANSVFI